jgi:endonuclease YncB( thermonuclease family)
MTAIGYRRAPGMFVLRRLVGAALVILVASRVGAQSVIDGDSIDVDGKIYRLHGVDAPDSSQICADGWPAGYAAERYLDDLIEGKRIRCVPIVGGREDDTTAICRADGVDLGAAMVTGGYAFAYVPYSARYIAQEAAAASAHRGVHAHKCIAPWEWRARLGQSR